MMAIDGEVSNCVNYGTIKMENGRNCGGICGNLGRVNCQVVVNECTNAGTVQGELEVGGIVGVLSINGTISNCSNIGSVKCFRGIAGGIVAHTNQKDKKSNCVVEKCYNSGNIQGPQYLGGIVAYFCGESEQGAVKNCYSKGLVETDKENIGAIIGAQIKYGGNAKFENLYYLNTVGLYAINNNETYNTDTVKAVEDDIKSYEEFIEWISKVGQSSQNEEP